MPNSEEDQTATSDSCSGCRDVDYPDRHRRDDDGPVALAKIRSTNGGRVCHNCRWNHFVDDHRSLLLAGDAAAVAAGGDGAEKGGRHWRCYFRDWV